MDVAEGGNAGLGSFGHEVSDGQGNVAWGLVTALETVPSGVGVQPNAVGLAVEGVDRVFTGSGSRDDGTVCRARWRLRLRMFGRTLNPWRTVRHRHRRVRARGLQTAQLPFLGSWRLTLTGVVPEPKAGPVVAGMGLVALAGWLRWRRR